METLVTSDAEVLEKARLALKVLRNVARDALVAVAQAEEVLLTAQPREAQPDEHNPAVEYLQPL